MSNAAESAETDGKPTTRSVPPGPVISKDGWLVNPRVRCSASVACTCSSVCALFEAGAERGLVEARQRRSELLQPGHYRVAAGDFPLALEEQLVHLPELTLLPGARRGFGGADAALAEVEHGAEDELHLPLAHVFVNDFRLYR